MKTLTLYRTLFKQTVIGLRRYKFDTLTGMITLFMFFLALFFGAKALGAGAPKFGNALEGLVVGYAVWALAMFTYSSMSDELVREAQQGTLEQLAMSPLGLRKVLMGKVLAGLVWQFVMITAITTLMMASSGKWLHIDALSIFPLALLTMAPIVGLGLIMGGLAVVFKKVQSALQILHMGFIACIAVPLSLVPALKFAPLAWGNRLIGKVMIDGESLLSLPAGDVWFLVMHATAYLVFGLVIFKYFERIARYRGLLGHY